MKRRLVTKLLQRYLVRHADFSGHHGACINAVITGCLDAAAAVGTFQFFELQMNIAGLIGRFAWTYANAPGCKASGCFGGGRASDRILSIRAIAAATPRVAVSPPQCGRLRSRIRDSAWEGVGPAGFEPATKGL